MRALDPLKFPLSGQRLIEASAGTGKTYTIAALYLRLLLERQLSVTEILVVTFTEAATQELRGRIRQRIHEALLLLEGRGEKDDPTLQALVGPYLGDQGARQRLRDAIVRMDEAAIYTIHGFCQRTLGDGAFESGVLFDSDFTTEELPLRLRAAQDLWRRTLQSMDEEETAWLLQHWSGPEALLDALDPLIAHPEARRLPEGLNVTALEHQRQAAFEAVAERWRTEGEALRQLLDTAPGLTRNAKSYRQDRLDALYAAVDDYLAGGDASVPLPASFELLTPEVLGASLKKNGTAPEHPLFAEAAALARVHQAVESTRHSRFLIDAADAVSDSLERAKASGRTLFFDDLLRKLDQALAGQGGGRLAARVRSQHPLAMIDEFQDTDPLQYRIFSRIYRGHDECGLFMIGDPKQAIYSFRGADIFTYMQARHDTDAQQDHFTLGTNWRSHSRLVSAVNALFEQAEAPFIYDEEIPFQPVEAAGHADATPLCIDGVEAEPLSCWFVEMDDDNGFRGSIPGTWSGPNLARGCAAEIARLLTLGQSGRATIGERPLAAHDIAVLVRSRREAALIREALAEAGVSSVTISRDSVFHTEEARDLAHLLRAVAEPGDPVLLRTALATHLLGWTATAIHQLNHDEQAWEARAEAFISYQRLWRSHGFMPMLHALLKGEGVIARLLGQGGGERRITNLLQLAELAQLAEQRHPGAERLLRWLADRRASANGDSEEQQLRMESDEDLVQIVTIHKSKGLEYPLVFLPYLWGGRPVEDKGILGYHDGPDRTLHLDTGSLQREGALALADNERLAEDLRLLYVALTRARYRCTFSWGRFRGAEHSALGWLLHRGDMASLDEAELRAALEPLAAVEPLPQPGAPFTPGLESDAEATALRFSGSAAQRWRVTSFTALSLSHDHHQDYRTELPDYDLGVESAPIDEGEPLDYPPFRFPRGAHAGLLLHHLLENIDFARAGAGELEPLVVQGLRQYGIDPQWHEALIAWIGAILDTPMDDQGLSLRAISEGQRLVEMEFHFPLQGLEATALNTILAQHRGEGRAAPALSFEQVRGMLKGFVDLIFEYQGRYYIVDYKSNHLGDRFEAYRPERLHEAIDGHHYDLQYLIYSVALHRYLARRVPGYRYESHFGGIYYLFLRGMKPERGSECGVHHDRPPLATIEALDRLFSGGES